jgi:hypothetical protein
LGKESRASAAFERATLHGLTVYARRRVSFGKQDPERARELFIRGALVDGEFETKLPFFAHNRKLLADIEQLEHKSRRQDVLVDDELIFGFYDSLVPKGIYSGAAFERWYRDEGKKAGASRLLFLSRDDLMRHEAAGITTDLFPKRMTMAGIEMTLTYHFEPGSPRDGVTLTVPLFGLNQVDARRSEWLVRGMLKEKIQLLLKSLPQKLRRHLVPLPEFSAGVVERHSGKTFGAGGLLEALIADIREQTQIAMKPSDFKLETLPAHLFMNFKVIDEHGRQLAMGRNLAQLRTELGGQAQQHFQKLAAGATLDMGGDAAAPVTRNASDCPSLLAPRSTKTSPPGISESCPNCLKFGGAVRRCSAIRRWSIGERIATLKYSIRRKKRHEFIGPVCADCSHCNCVSRSGISSAIWAACVRCRCNTWRWVHRKSWVARSSKRHWIVRACKIRFPITTRISMRGAIRVRAD